MSSPNRHVALPPRCNFRPKQDIPTAAQHGINVARNFGAAGSSGNTSFLVPDLWYDVALVRFETVWKMGVDVGWTGDGVYRHSQHIGVAETEMSVYACEIGECNGCECG